MATETQFTFDDPIGSGVNATGTVSGTITLGDGTPSTADVTVTTSNDGSSTFIVTPGGTTTAPGPGGTATLNGVEEPNGPDTSGIVLSIPGAAPNTVSSLIEFDYTGTDPTTFDNVFFQPSDYNSSNAYTAPDTNIGIPDAAVTTTSVVVCYASGTLIRTSRGDVTVEDLRVGDLAVTASGAHRPVAWVGHRVINCRRHPRRHEVMPVRISAHAFSDNRPARDLCVSPGHAICVDLLGEVLIPASSLLNGTTIRQIDVETVTYHHIELDSHDVILAENLPCESYLEMENRSFFVEAEATDLHSSPDARIVSHLDFCRPFHKDGPIVAFTRERLAARSPALGWMLQQAPLANLHLLVDGHRIEPETSDLSVRFVVPAGATEMWLMSETSVPAEVGPSSDLRSLGVCVGRLVVDDGFGSPRTILADDPCLCVGFHHIEDGPQRWTAGRARIPAQLWSGCRGSFFIRIDLTRPALPRWVAAATAERPNQLLSLAG